MTLALLTIRDLYASMEQGNIGKLVIALDDGVWVYTAQCMGGNRRGREGILQQVPAFYRPGTGIKKNADHFVEQGSMIIVLGNIQITVPGASIGSMTFVDVWRFENGNISSVNFYYRDPEELYVYLEHFS
ncbi:hypothetical protein A4R26_00535 [Niastella populi]|uniref:SnoaL-like domain-containing protein n=2 Tax=Niastella populi TaxID=550983 RepID=A0A1V9GCD4_9BACT|nr:hypothetical protein A4R26_00535 [Niastella populi]